jgi:hypothetical protein
MGDHDPSPDPAVAELVAKQAITEVIYGYCRGLDRMDRELARRTWHDDGTADYGPMFQGTGVEFVDWVWTAHEAFAAHSHQVTNVLIQVDVGAERAVSESYVTVALRLPPDDGNMADIVGRGRYLDRWSRRDGRWAVDHRQYVDDFQALYPVAVTEITDMAAATGRRGPEDPSYEVLR